VLLGLAECSGNARRPDMSRSDLGSQDHRGTLDIGRADKHAQDDSSDFDHGRLDCDGPDSVLADRSWVAVAGAAEGWAEAFDVAMDGAGDLYVAGRFGGNATAFGSSILKELVPRDWSEGGEAYLAKLEGSTGSFLWAVSLAPAPATPSSAPGRSTATRIAIDASGNVYVAGSFAGTALLDSIPVESQGDEDGFIAAVSTHGKILWTRVVGAGPGFTRPDDIALDSSRNIYLTGAFDDEATFGTTTLVSEGAENDLFVAKFDVTPTVVWAVRGGGVGSDEGRRLTVSGNGDLFVAGTFTGEAKFGTVSVTAQGTTASHDTGAALVAKMAPTGDFVWVAQGGGSAAMADAIAVDNSGNISTAGLFEGSATFGTKHIIGKAGVVNSFAAGLSPSGTFVWATWMGVGYAADSAVDSVGLTYVAGAFLGTAQMGPKVLTAVGGSDLFVAKIDSSGKLVGAISAGSAREDAAWGILLDSRGRLCVAGYVRGTGTITFGPKTVNLSGAAQGFVWQLPATWL